MSVCSVRLEAINIACETANMMRDIGRRISVSVCRLSGLLEKDLRERCFTERYFIETEIFYRKIFSRGCVTSTLFGVRALVEHSE